MGIIKLIISQVKNFERYQLSSKKKNTQFPLDHLIHVPLNIIKFGKI